MGIVITNGVQLNSLKMVAGNVPSTTTATVITNGLSLYYDASNASSYPGSGNTVTDLSGNSRTGTLQGTAGGYSNVAGGAWTFNGTDQFITTNYIPSNTCTFQIAFYNNTSYSTPWNRGIFSTYGGTNYYGIYVAACYTTLNTNGMHMYTDNNTLFSIGVQNSTFAINTWYILTVVSTGSQVRVYLNGNTNPITTASTTTSHADTLAIGTSKFDARYWTGYIGNFLTYNRALSTTEIATNYNTLKTRFGLS